LKCVDLVPAKPPLPQDAIHNRARAKAERRRVKCKAKHKEAEIAKHERNDQRAKCRKLKEIAIIMDEYPSPSPAWTGDD
jgi:hypothetical protein